MKHLKLHKRKQDNFLKQNSWLIWEFLLGQQNFLKGGVICLQQKIKLQRESNLKYEIHYAQNHILKNVCHFTDGRNFVFFYQLFLSMKPGRLLIHGISFQLQLMNLTKFVEQYCLDHCGSYWMRP